MLRILIFILISAYVISCTPKLATSVATKDYTEDVSDFRPTVETSVEEEVAEIQPSQIIDRGPYIPPTHDINKEMNEVLDSIIVYNRDKLYLTFTIQVYIGRSREEANQVREKVYGILPEEKPELVYRQPSYKVNVGKYIERVDAYKPLTILKREFPGAMIVPIRERME